MSNSRKPSKLSSFGKWLGLQLAGKALGFALGLPAVTGCLTAAAAYAQGLPLTWGIVAVAAVVAFTSTAANQIRSFALSYSVAGKLRLHDVKVGLGVDTEKKWGGYAIGFVLRNAGDIPLEFLVHRASAHIDGQVVRHNPDRPDGIVQAGTQHGYMIGVAKSDPVADRMMEGELEFDLSYGRPGKLKHRMAEKYKLFAQTAPNGEVIHEMRFLV